MQREISNRESFGGTKSSKITSWVTTTDGSVIESDLKFYPGDEGTYELETSKESFGLILGLDPATQQYTVILDVKSTKSLNKFKHLISKGDILVAINDNNVIDESYEGIVMLLDMLIKGSFSRKIKFLNPKICSLPMYLQRMEIVTSNYTDMLGFSCSFAYHLEEIAMHAMQNHSVTKRDIEWVGYLKSIGGPENLKPVGVFKPSKDLKAIVRRGIPVAYRSIVWQKLSLCNFLRREFPSNYYSMLIAKLPELDPKVKDEIEKDVDRTFPEHSYFELGGQGEQTLRRILQAYAIYNPKIGYCQGLNFITGMMLIFMEEEDAFWLLVTVVERLLPEDYFTRSMVGTYVDQYVLAHIVKKCLPKIHNAFEKHNIQLQLVTVHWFMCAFVNTLRPEVTLRIWDMFLNEGSKVLFRIAIALFKINETKFLKTKDAADLFNLIKNIGNDVTDADELISIAYQSYNPKPNLFDNNTQDFYNIDSTSIRSHILSSDLLNPRLKIKLKDQGLVPNKLIGVGLGHIGPYQAENARDIPIPFNTNDVRHRAESFASMDDSYSMDNSNNLNLNDLSIHSNIGILPSTTSDSNNNNIEISIRSRLSSKDFLKSPLQVPSDLCSLDEYIVRNPQKFKIHRSKNNKYKAFEFYRSDISLWRCSFRPSLEERQRTMEEARESWRKSNVTRRESADSNYKLPTTIHITNNIATTTTTTTTTNNNNNEGDRDSELSNDDIEIIKKIKKYI